MCQAMPWGSKYSQSQTLFFVESLLLLDEPFGELPPHLFIFLCQHPLTLKNLNARRSVDQVPHRISDHARHFLLKGAAPLDRTAIRHGLIERLRNIINHTLDIIHSYLVIT